MANLRRGLIGAVGGFGEGLAAAGQDQIKKNAALADALRKEAMQLRSFAHDEKMQKGGFEHSENLQGKSFEHAETMQEKGQTHAENMQGKSFEHAENLQKGGFQHAETLQSQDQAFRTGLANMEMKLKERQIEIEGSKLAKMDKANEIAEIKNKIATLDAANKHLELGGSPESANAILQEGGINLEYRDVITKKGEKGWFSDTPDETRTVLGRKGLISDAATPTTSTAPGEISLDSLLEKGRAASGKTTAQTSTDTVKPSGMIASEKAQAIPENLPASLNDLDSMVKKLPVEMDGIYKKSPSWERGRNISEGVSSVTGQSQATQNPEMLRKGENDLTKAIRIATGKTDIYELNIIADKLQTIYKGKLSDSQLANLIKEGKLLGNRTGA